MTSCNLPRDIPPVLARRIKADSHVGGLQRIHIVANVSGHLQGKASSQGLLSELGMLVVFGDTVVDSVYDAGGIDKEQSAGSVAQHPSRTQCSCKLGTRI